MSDAPELVTVTIDGQEVQVPPGTLVIRAAEQLGITIPRFCDHPLLDPVAACRQCLVDVEGARKPTPACSEQVRPDMVVRTQETSEVARQYQQSQMEFLLVNHPLDCPQCDKGGECPLQDQALSHGPSESRMYERKRVYTKALPINALISLDRERCVLCARCTRFSKQISGDPFIELFERGALEQVSIYADQPYESYFSGNVTQICPVGALTSKDYRFGARPFDLKRVPGIAFQDASGANVRHDVRRGVIQRTLARENMVVNEAWLDDKNRYGHHFIASEERLTQPQVRGDAGALEPTSWAAALDAAADALDGVDPDKIGVLTGGRLTDEDAYAVSRFARDVLHTDNVDFRLAPSADDLAVLPLAGGVTDVTYESVEHASCVVIAGLEPHEELPLLFLRLRKAWRNKNLKIVVVGPVMGRLEEIAWQWLPTEIGGETEALKAMAERSVPALNPVLDQIDGDSVVLAGERLGQTPGALTAAWTLAEQTGAKFAWVPRRAGSRGAVEAGLLPGSLPGGRPLSDAGDVEAVWNRVPTKPGNDVAGILNAAAAGEITHLWLIGVDPVSDYCDPEVAENALKTAETVIASDILPNESLNYADVVFPAAAPTERVGSYTNWEGRRQAWPMVTGAVGQILPDWDILNRVSSALHDRDDSVTELGWVDANDVRREAAPLMAHAENAAGSTAEATTKEPSTLGGDGTLTAIIVPQLLAGGTTLVGADELLDAAPNASIWIHPDDLGEFVHGDRVNVVGPRGEMTLHVKETSGIARGVVALPQHATRNIGETGVTVTLSRAEREEDTSTKGAA